MSTAPISLNGPYISGSTNATLTLSNVQPAQAGNVFVVITNNAGSITSSVVTLTVNVPATITNQPQTQAVVAGQTATFSVGADRHGELELSVVFQRRHSWAARRAKLPTNSLSAVGTNNAGNYTVVVNNNYGTVTSTAVSLTVLQTQPVSQTVAVGANASFYIGVSSPTNLSYQWSRNGTNISAATNATLTLANVQLTNSGSYAAAITTPAGILKSSAATLTVLKGWVGTVTNTSDSGAGSLRQTILTANSNSTSPRSIVFNIPGAGPFTISPLSLLPVITNSVTIDATTQPGWSSTNQPVVEVSGNSLPNGVTGDGLVLTASSNTVKGLAIAGFQGNGITLTNNSGSVIQGNYIGWDLGGSKLANTGNGIMLYNSASNVIGGTNSTSGNVVVTSGNDGIHVEGTHANGNQVLGNIVGMTAVGTGNGSAVGVTGNGIVITNASANIIGGNLISGNKGDGLDLGGVSAAFNVVQGNLIGTDITGTNAAKNNVNGISIVNSSSNSIGGLIFATANVISCNGGNGIALSGAAAQSNAIQGNFIGTDKTGTLNLKNNSAGVSTTTAINNVVGGLTSSAGNIIAYNGSGGVTVSGGQCAILGNSLFSNSGNPGDISLLNAGNSNAVPPVLSGATNNTGVTWISGTFTNSPNASYRIEFFASPNSADAETFLGATNVVTSATGVAIFNIVLTSGNITNQYVTATATDAGGNTSQISTSQSVGFYGLPAIINAPQNLTAVAGNSAGLSVVASGSPAPAYQWYFNGNPLPNATSAVLSFSPITTNNAGNYSVVVSNTVGSVTSTPALITVLLPLGITTQPLSQTVTAGQSASFSVVPNGTAPFSYQWTFNHTNLIGATNATLSFTSVQTNNAGTYAVVVTNLAGSVTSSNATLAVNVPPTIKTQPVSKTATQGSNVVISVVASGTAPFGYQWIFDGTNLVGATSSTLSLNNVQTNNAGTYAVVITNIVGSVTSSNVTLTVNVPAGITTQPVSQTVMQGSNVVFSVAASGTAPFAYQWTFNGTNLAGATSSALSLSNVQTNNAGTYAVVVTNMAGSVTSSNVTLTVNVPVGITTQPVSQTVIQGSNVVFSVVASGTGPLGYQWTFNGTNLTGSTSSTLSLNNVQTNNAGTYSVVVTNVAGSVTSSNAMLTVNVPAGIVTQPSDQTAIQGSNVVFSVVASGTAPFGYQWSFNGTNLDGATSSTLALNNVQTNNAGTYSVVVTNVAGSVTSSNAMLTVQCSGRHHDPAGESDGDPRFKCCIHRRGQRHGTVRLSMDFERHESRRCDQFAARGDHWTDKRCRGECLYIDLE